MEICCMRCESMTRLNENRERIMAMILTKGQLRLHLKEGKRNLSSNKKKTGNILTLDNQFKLYQYVRLLRLAEYHYNNRKNLFHKILYVFYRRKNILGRKLEVEMWKKHLIQDLPFIL